MVQHSFSTGQGDESESTTHTAALDIFLDNQHQSYYEELYQSEAACLCLFRLLPPVCRQIILHVLWSHSTLRSVDLKPLLGQDTRLSLEVLQHLLRPLIDRKMIGAMTTVKAKVVWPLSDSFKKGLRNALTGMGSSNSFGVAYEVGPDDELPGVNELIEYGERTWQDILKYMVSSGLDVALDCEEPRPAVLKLLHASGLMTGVKDLELRRSGSSQLTITSKGFQFLLEDRQTQVWQILIYYLTQRETANSAPTLSLLLTLGVLQIGQAYSVSKSFPTPAHQEVLHDLENFGFIYRPSDPQDESVQADYFYPTHLATTLCSGDLAGQLGGKDQGGEKQFLILETNYKIYAYTDNELEIAILNLFVDITIRYPNLVVGKLDRKNVKAAMARGISAYQIIAYLQSHAHAQMHNTPPPLLHPTIVDQLHLWDKERNRLKTEDALMITLYSKELYDDVVAEAKRYDGLVYALPSQKKLFVAPHIKEGIRDFIQTQKAQL